MVSIHASAREATARDEIGAFEIHVSIHASAREATVAVLGPIGAGAFRSTPLRERRPTLSQHRRAMHCFDLRLCARGDRAPGACPPTPPCFDPCLCARGDPTSFSTLRPMTPFRSTPLRERRLVEVVSLEHRDLVSIHASAREATRRSTRARASSPCFDPRLCARGDRSRSSSVARLEFRSTPLRERRRGRELCHRFPTWFRSTPLRERRHFSGFTVTISVQFRSTPLRERRLGLRDHHAAL